MKKFFIRVVFILRVLAGTLILLPAFIIWLITGIDYLTKYANWILDKYEASKQKTNDTRTVERKRKVLHQ